MLNKTKTEQLNKFKSVRKLDVKSLYTRIDKILRDFRTNRAEFHGGELNGVHLKKLMDNAEEIMNQVRDYLIKSL